MAGGSASEVTHHARVPPKPSESSSFINVHHPPPGSSGSWPVFGTKPGEPPVTKSTRP